MVDPVADRAAALVRAVDGWINENLTPGPAMAYGVLFGGLSVVGAEAIGDRDWLTAVWAGLLLSANVVLYRRSVRPRLIDEGSPRCSQT